MMPAPPPAPRWFAVVIVAVLLPLFQFPLLLSECPAGGAARTLLWIYPVYALTAGYLAWQCYGAGRRALAWILLALLVLSHLAIWMLVRVGNV